VKFGDLVKGMWVFIEVILLLSYHLSPESGTAPRLTLQFLRLAPPHARSPCRHLAIFTPPPPTSTCQLGCLTPPFSLMVLPVRAVRQIQIVPCWQRQAIFEN
jgi:hypothetical protein